MTAEEELTVEERIIRLLQHLGIERAHIAASGAEDLRELLQTRGDLIASLTLVLPLVLVHDVLSPFESRLLLLTSEHGTPAKQVYDGMATLPNLDLEAKGARRIRKPLALLTPCRTQRVPVYTLTLFTLPSDAPLTAVG